MQVKTGLGQDSHCFDFEDKNKPLILGGIIFDSVPPLKGNSDADVVLHAITNAVSSITGVNILGAVSDKLCLGQGITDSAVYLQKSLEYLSSWTISHISCSIECKSPKISPKIEEMKRNISALLQIMPQDVVFYLSKNTQAIIELSGVSNNIYVSGSLRDNVRYSISGVDNNVIFE